jgi:hypothetical protein
MQAHELWAEAGRLHTEGKKDEVVALLRKYGLFRDEGVVREYLTGKED